MSPVALKVLHYSSTIQYPMPSFRRFFPFYHGSIFYLWNEATCNNPRKDQLTSGLYSKRMSQCYNWSSLKFIIMDKNSFQGNVGFHSSPSCTQSIPSYRLHSSSPTLLFGFGFDTICNYPRKAQAIWAHTPKWPVIVITEAPWNHY